MTPTELARRHPELYHVTTARSEESIRRHGLLTTCDILELWGVEEPKRTQLMTRLPPKPFPIEHRALGPITLNDNKPLSEAKLANVLDDGLTPAEWLKMLNSRVFFFVGGKPLKNFMNASPERGVLVVDTLSLVEAYADLVEIAPINTGNTYFNPVRRGRSTFAPLLETDFAVWQRSRPKKSADTIREVTVRASIPDIAKFLKHVRYAETAA
jgi:hypothetical protein